MTTVKEIRAILAELPDDLQVWTGKASGGKISMEPLQRVLPVNMGGHYILVLAPEPKRATDRPCLLDFLRKHVKTFKNFAEAVRVEFARSQKNKTAKAMDGLAKVADKITQKPEKP